SLVFALGFPNGEGSGDFYSQDLSVHRYLRKSDAHNLLGRTGIEFNKECAKGVKVRVCLSSFLIGPVGLTHESHIVPDGSGRVSFIKTTIASRNNGQFVRVMSDLISKVEGYDLHVKKD
ncbi:MAG: hypothetical protein KJ879_03620, partial [Nanoarchaeota archaeon]|nr:hypothetical protein [Nanoarchaeota archaeon]